MKLAKKTETNFSQGRYWQETEIEVTECTDPMEMIQLIPEVVDQEVEGFGGAFTEASAYNYAKLGKRKNRILSGIILVMTACGTTWAGSRSTVVILRLGIIPMWRRVTVPLIAFLYCMMSWRSFP